MTTSSAPAKALDVASEVLRLGKDLEIPAARAVTQKFAFIARSGAGKTYAAGVLVEELAGKELIVRNRSEGDARAHPFLFAFFPG